MVCEGQTLNCSFPHLANAVITGVYIFHRRVRYCSSLFVTVRHCSLLFIAVPNCIFFVNFNAILHLLKKIKLYNFVYCCVRHRFFLFRTSCDHDDEKLPLKYIVERTRFYVSLKLEKTVTNCSVEKNYLIETHGRANKN